MVDISSATGEAKLVIPENASIDDIVKLITKFATSYYEGNPEISDDAFNSLVDVVLDNDPINPILTTTSWGYIPKSTHLDEFEHNPPLLTITNRVKYETIKSGMFVLPEGIWIAMPKLDGGSCCAYPDTNRALSKGNGYTGLDITANLIASKSIPDNFNMIPLEFVRGEVVQSFNDFKIMGGKHPRNNGRKWRNALSEGSSQSGACRTAVKTRSRPPSS